MSAPLPSVLAFALMLCAALGGGGLLLRAVGVDRDLETGERAVWAFVLGFGVVGWTEFFLGLEGLLGPWPQILLCVALLPGLTVLVRGVRDVRIPEPDGWTWMLLALLAVILILDLFEGVSPPSDADSLAYHFFLPKHFLDEGRLVFIPRALDGATALLAEMTYTLALGLGGERTMTLWTMITGWSAGAAVYVVARHHLSRNWSLLTAILLLCSPVVVYAGGSGQVEIRNAAFTLLAAVAAARAIQGGGWRWALAAGLAAGFFAASKFTGLLVVAACGIAVMIGPGWLARALAFGLGALLAGSQWYAWLAWNTGDPVFPMLFGHIPYAHDTVWNAAENAYYRQTMGTAENAIPKSLFNWFAYPFEALFRPQPAFEALRAGFGPVAALLLPVAALGWIARGRSALRSPMAILLLVCAVDYSLWFWLGPSQRLRHMLPIYPLLLLPVMVATEQGIRTFPWARPPVMLALAATLGIQMVAVGLFGANYVRHIASGESRETYLEQTVQGANVPHWINSHLRDTRGVFIITRQWQYLLDVPVFFANASLQIQIEIRPDNRDPARFWRQLIRNRVGHMVLPRGFGMDLASSEGGLPFLFGKLREGGCVAKVRSFETVSRQSRTLPGLAASAVVEELFRLTPASCRWASGKTTDEKVK